MSARCHLFLPMVINRGKPINPARALRDYRGRHQLNR